jgi:putative acetyltransferase
LFNKIKQRAKRSKRKPSASTKMPYTIVPASTPIDYTTASTLFHAYASSLNLDLTFQGFTNELDNLQKMYSPPTGVLLLAKLNSTTENDAIGCVGVRALDDSLGICEMKRLYVGPEGRGKGIGKALAQSALLEAKRLGYAKMRLDTLATMTAALELYRSSGFKEIAAYYHNPLDGVVYLEADLK